MVPDLMPYFLGASWASSMVEAASSIVREMIKRFMSMILSLSKITIKIENFKFEMLPARWLRYSKLFSFYLFKGFLFVMCVSLTE